MTNKKNTNPLSFEDIVPAPHFVKENAGKNGMSENQLRWLFRNRKINGMAKSGAVIEKTGRYGKGKRPMLFVVVPKFVEWLATDDSAKLEEMRKAG